MVCSSSGFQAKLLLTKSGQDAYPFRQETLVRIQCRLHSFQQKNIREMSDYKRNPISDFNKGLIMGIGVTAICYSVLMFILISLFK